MLAHSSKSIDRLKNYIRPNEEVIFNISQEKFGQLWSDVSLKFDGILITCWCGFEAQNNAL